MADALDLLQIGDACLLDGGHGLEVCQQGGTGLFAYAGQGGQRCRVGAFFHGALAVIVGVAVGFVLNVGHKGKDIAVAVYGNFAPGVIHDGTGAVVVVLDHAEGGHVFQRRTLERLFYGTHLPPAAVDEQQVGQGGKLVLRSVRLFAAAGGLILGGTTGERFRQRGVVVGAGHAFHLKAAVAAAVGFAVLKDDHAADAGAVAPVGDVVAFDHAGRGLQTQ